MFERIFGHFSTDLGIDIGTASTIVYVKEKGIVIQEPSVVAINSRNDQIIAVGEEAKQMIGKTPAHIITSRPLLDGVVSDFEVAEKMLKHFIDKVHRETFSIFPRPRVVINVPLDVTEVERKAVEDAVMNAGAREVFLIEEPMAAAIGARLPIQDSTGNMIIEMGAGTTEIAVIALGGVVAWKSLRLGGDELSKNIINYVRDQFNVLLGEKTAEEAKITIGSAHEKDAMMETKVRGRDLLSGLPKAININSNHLREAMSRNLGIIIDNIKLVIESTPPELVADIYEKGVYLSGGTSQLRGLAKKISQEISIPVTVVDDPLTAVVRGTGIVLENIEASKDLFVVSQGDLI
ncbi:MAG: rod shape-determining protein [Candidatus Kerfeldbacteria bacterium RIFOXYA2_FULL_38_24]|uniref:Cell shape-determining protein MreB n=1 Tax=Candidatus Kerfeldbacteria bacterium RIFOXYB2_FULL_38_14 TaxID=1798547 RepID=A0A1G2BAJ8_9BACT|nr:MAG: rod shape-determining protein [Candidatus Kerfeldbacteria bacterium RIFOXYA2_FULL_38_24]OGY86035.1 MAG: rod shape-determining protein [Candidatus Kerfeldbacteria bacterium RIFOXYB2_FULL_38_14]OGY90151.1 MAG: rod shape-determining protein [Candidatus Kerfeldbacteria bacterium RIFOXYC2_FULL_38_9]